jgi:hypothetical protein
MPAEGCKHCSREVRLVSLIPPLGRDPGCRIFYCDKCRHFTKSRWPGFFQQQQQSQPTPKKDK